MKNLNGFPTIFLCAPVEATPHAMVTYLDENNFKVHIITDCAEAETAIVTSVPDVVVLDIDLPSIGGFDVCDKIRPYYRGLIFIQGYTRNEAVQLLAFDRGADDYVTLPLSPALFAARINARLRRERGLNSHTCNLQIKSGKLAIDATRREVTLAGKSIELTSLQFELLWYLAKRSGRVVPRKELYEAIYQTTYNNYDRSVDVQISRIRQHLGDPPDTPTYLKTVRGVGYLFIPGLENIQAPKPRENKGPDAVTQCYTMVTQQP